MFVEGAELSPALSSGVVSNQIEQEKEIDYSLNFY